MYFLEPELSVLHGCLARNPHELFDKLCGGYMRRAGKRDPAWKLMGAAENTALLDAAMDVIDPLYVEMHRWALDMPLKEKA